jgi:hypothetical protein
MTVSTRALTTLADALRRHRRTRATRWRKLSAGRQALLVVAYLRKGDTYADLACGFRIGTSTVYRYLREAITLLAAMAPTLDTAIEVASRKAYVILDGTLLRIDRVGMATGRGPGERANAQRALDSADVERGWPPMPHAALARLRDALAAATVAYATVVEAVDPDELDLAG